MKRIVKYKAIDPYYSDFEETYSDKSFNRVAIRVTTQKESGSRFNVGDTVYASIDLQTIKKFKVETIFDLSGGSDIWYRLEPMQFLPENRVFKTEFECRSDLIRRFNG